MKRAASLSLLLAAAVAAALVGLASPAAAEAGPTLTITTPAEGVTITANSVEIVAAYTGAGANIERLELAVDGAVVSRLVIDPPQAQGRAFFVWNAGRSQGGLHEIGVRAVDTAGVVGEASIAVFVQRVRPAVTPGPGVRVISPLPGQSVAGRTLVQVEADEPAHVRYVVFLVDDVFKAMSNVQPFTYLWDTTRYLNGLHQLRAKAYLSDGGTALSAPVEVRVDNPSGATTLREPQALASAPAAPPARTTPAPLPPPSQSRSPTPEPVAVQVAQAELALPGTAPFVSPTGELVRPPAPRTTPAGATAAPITAPTLAAEPIRTTDAPAGETAEPAAAPIEVALLPSPEPPPAALHRAPSLPPTADPLTAAAAEGTAVAPNPRAEVQIALLPPPAPEVRPAPRLAAEPAPAPRETIHVVQPGEWLWAIAERHKVSAKAILRANNLADPSLIHPGQRLRIPTTEVYLNGRPLETQVATTISEGRSMVSLRALVEGVGGRVSWLPAARQANAVARNRELTVTIGSREAKVDGRPQLMSAPAALQHNRTVVPLRFLGDALDLLLQYEDGVIHVAAR